MRVPALASLALLAATPLHAWEFSSVPVCTVSHATPEASVEVTYDPRQAELYAIRLTRRGAWAGAPVFSIRFDGPRGLTISTARHRLTADGATLTVTDSGFGNVLNGLEFNATVTAVLGEAEVTLPLAGAAPAVQAFRACARGGLA